MAAIADAIRKAQDEQRWSLTELAGVLGKTDDTLARWRDGKTAAIDIEALVRIFDYAGLSMDSAFGISAEEEADEWRESMEARIAALEARPTFVLGTAAPPAAPTSLSTSKRAEEALIDKLDTGMKLPATPRIKPQRRPKTGTK